MVLGLHACRCMHRLAPRALSSSAATAPLGRAGERQASDLTLPPRRSSGRELLVEHCDVSDITRRSPSPVQHVSTNAAEPKRHRLLGTASCVVSALGKVLMRGLSWTWLVAAGLPGLLAAQTQNVVVPTPHLMVGDRVVVKVWPEVKLSDTAVVDDRGEISLPHVGSIGVLALDYDGLRDTLRARYAGFLRSPVIDVIAFRRVTVNGAVGKPDIYMIDVASTIRDVIARAGGVAPYGDAHRVSILRNGRSIAAPDWDTGAGASEYQLQSGDVILVGRRPWWLDNIGTVTGIAGLVASLAFTLLRK